MLAIAIIRHSLRLLLRNWRAALKISAIPFATLALGTLVQVAMLRNIAGSFPAPGEQALGSSFVPLFVMGLVIYISALWAAVSWHRHILLEEPASVLAPLRADRVLSYFGHSLLISLILSVVALLIVLVLAMLQSEIGPGAFSNMLILLIAGLPLVSIGLRLSTGLPGAALGQARPITTAWQATKGQMGCFVALALIGLIANQALAQITGAFVVSILTDGQLIGLLIAVLIDWLSVMVAISVLTTTHGHFVQGRTLV